MTAPTPTILATSGGYRPGSRTRLEFDALVHYAVELAGVSGRNPRVTYVGTAGGDQAGRIADMHGAAHLAGYRLSTLQLFTMPNLADIEGHLAEQDVIWVDGGSVANLLAVWRVHGLAEVFERVWQSGVVLAGLAVLVRRWHHGLLRAAAAAGHQRSRIVALRQRRAL